METLTLQELAALKGCHRVRIQQLVTEGFYKSDASIFIGQVKHLEFDLIRNQSH